MAPQMAPQPRLRGTFVALGALLGAAAAPGRPCKCYRQNPEAPEYVRSPRMHELFAMESLPEQLDWRGNGAHNFTTTARNQHIPKYCGACWAFSSTSALSDRIRIAHGAVGPEVNLAVQVVLNCDMDDMGCDGGDAITAYKFIKDAGGIPEETCQPYEAEGHDTGRTCHAADVCTNCDERGCFAQDEYEVYKVEEYGNVRGEFAMMAELQRGPIACAISTPQAFLDFVGDDIFQDDSHDKDIDHMISVVGYGTDNGVKYWVMRNSWGTYWGNYGWARVTRGVNNLLIESGCAWATPANKGRPDRVRVRKPSAASLAARPLSEAAYINFGDVHAGACRVPHTDWEAVGGERIHSPRPHVTDRDLPTRWDWRNVSGTGFVTGNKNENLPRFCRSCWAQAVASALSDRLLVRYRGKMPQVSLSTQVLINCHAGGTCSGGDPAGVYAYIHEHGITDETCQAYRGKELECDLRGVCENCAPNMNEHGIMWPGNCVAVPVPIKYFVSEYGAVRGARDMKAEIFQRGPIACGLEMTRGFKEYSGGIYSEFVSHPRLNHHVSLAGWSWSALSKADEAAESSMYWIGRNSWGSYWGEGGWFRMQMHHSNLGIETDCDWGVPEQTAPLTESLAAAAVEPLAAAAQAPPAVRGIALLLALAGGLAVAGRRLQGIRAAADDDAYIRVA